MGGPENDPPLTHSFVLWNLNDKKKELQARKSGTSILMTSCGHGKNLMTATLMQSSVKKSTVQEIMMLLVYLISTTLHEKRALRHSYLE